MAKLIINMEFHVDVEELGAAYSNEDYLTEELKEQLAYALYRFDAQDLVFNRIDIEGM